MYCILVCTASFGKCKPWALLSIFYAELRLKKKEDLALRAEGPKRAAQRLTRSWCWSVALARVHLDGLLSTSGNSNTLNFNLIQV